MAGGLGRKVWTRETLSSAELQGYLQDQAVMRFPSAAARNVAIPQPQEGMVCTLDSTGQTLRYHAAAGQWRDLGVSAVASGDVVAGRFVGQYRDHPVVGLQRWNGTRWHTVGGGYSAGIPLAQQINPGGVYGYTAAQFKAAALGMDVLVMITAGVRFLNGASQQTLQMALHASAAGFTLGNNNFDQADRIPGAPGSGEVSYQFERYALLNPTSLDLNLGLQLSLGTGGTSCIYSNPRVFALTNYSYTP